MSFLRRNNLRSMVLESSNGAAGPIYLGPRFDESPHDESRVWRNYPFAVSWMAHELSHRWAAYAKWNGPNPQALLDPPSYFHWSSLLNTPPRSTRFPNSSPILLTRSNRSWEACTPCGSPTARQKARQRSLQGAATGLCALDLYLMGMIGAEDVPDTFLIAARRGV